MFQKKKAKEFLVGPFFIAPKYQQKLRLLPPLRKNDSL
jgi:hypothetical protein